MIYVPYLFNGRCSGKPGLVCCPFDSQSPVILILSIPTGSISRDSSYLCTVGCTHYPAINCCLMESWSRIF